MEWLILGIIGINVFVFFLPYIVSFGANPFNSFSVFSSYFAKVNSKISDGEWYRLFTSNFLHADFIHLAVNMLSLFQIGPTVLNTFKMPGFLLIYIVSGLSGSLLSYFLSNNVSVGASGAIFGLVGALLAVSIRFGNFGLLSNIALIIVLNFGVSLSPGSRIDNYGHLGGLISGTLLGFLLVIK